MVKKMSLPQFFQWDAPRFSTKSVCVSPQKPRSAFHSYVKHAFAAGAIAALAATGVCAETYTGSIDSGRVERHYTIVLPDNAPDSPRLPTVIALHGPLMTGKSMRRLFDMDDLGQREGFAIVYPDSYGRLWNDGRVPTDEAPNDVRFINQLAQHLTQRGIADPTRLYLVGMSSGGMLAYRIACETPRTFAAYGAVVANMPKELARHCNPGVGVPFVLINSEHDRDIPEENEQAEWNQGKVLTAGATVDFWRRNNGCDSSSQVKPMPDKDIEDGSTVTAQQFQNCQKGNAVASFMVEGGGHLPPGAQLGNRSLLISVLGRPNRDISAADVSWKFFRRFPAAP